MSELKEKVFKSEIQAENFQEQKYKEGYKIVDLWKDYEKREFRVIYGN